MGCSYLADDVANVVVESVELVYELVRFTIGVVVSNGAGGLGEVDAFCFVWSGGFALGSWVASCAGRNDLNFGVLGLDGLVEHLESVLPVRVPSCGKAG